jgi:uncharacterized cupin superfamily protein
MRRLNFLDDEPWDEVHDEGRRRARWFGHPFETDMLGASLIELLPGAPGGPLHMHYGVEEMFFVLAGTPSVRTPEGEEALRLGDVVYFPEGRDGLHDFSNPADQPARLIGISAKRFPTSSHTPSGELHGSPPATPSGQPARTPTRESPPGSSYRRNRQTGSSGVVREHSPRR